VKGDVALIAGRAFPREVAEKRKALQERVERDGFGPTMEALAYTWFNRLVAIRYIELHGYLDHGYRVLSNPDPAKSMPEILEHAEHVELPDLNRNRLIAEAGVSDFVCGFLRRGCQTLFLVSRRG